MVLHWAKRIKEMPVAWSVPDLHPDEVVVDTFAEARAHDVLNLAEDWIRAQWKDTFRPRLIPTALGN